MGTRFHGELLPQDLEQDVLGAVGEPAGQEVELDLDGVCSSEHVADNPRRGHEDRAVPRTDEHDRAAAGIESQGTLRITEPVHDLEDSRADVDTLRANRNPPPASSSGGNDWNDLDTTTAVNPAAGAPAMRPRFASRITAAGAFSGARRALLGGLGQGIDLAQQLLAFLRPTELTRRRSAATRAAKFSRVNVVMRGGEIGIVAFLPPVIGKGRPEVASERLDPVAGSRTSLILETPGGVQRRSRTWTTHRTPAKRTFGKPVTLAEKKHRARQIASQLADHNAWKTHSRSITLEDLRGMRLEIRDYSADPALADSIRRYFTLLQMTFETNIYKVFETPTSQVVRYEIPPGQRVAQPPDANVAVAEIECPKCHQKTKIQANLKPGVPLQPDHSPFPADNQFTCPNCGTQQALSPMRQQIELRTKKKIVS